MSVDGRADRASAVTDTVQSRLLGGHNHGYHADPPPLDALSSSGGSGEVQTTTVRGLTFIKRGGWVFVSGNSSDSRQTVSSAFRPPSIVNIPYVSFEANGQGISIDSDGSIASLYEGDIQPTVYPAGEA